MSRQKINETMPLAFGDVKCCGKIFVKDENGKDVAMLKMAKIFTGNLMFRRSHEIKGAEKDAIHGNAMHVSKSGEWEYYLLPDELIVEFWPDFGI